jgi:hypothetical protein
VCHLQERRRGYLKKDFIQVRAACSWQDTFPFTAAQADEQRLW